MNGQTEQENEMRIDVRQLSTSTLADALLKAKDGDTILCRSQEQAALAKKGADRIAMRNATPAEISRGDFGMQITYEVEEEIL